MKRLSIHFIFLCIFLFSSSFGLIEYNSLKSKAKTVQLDSTQKVHSVQVLKSNYPTNLPEQEKTQKEKEDTNFMVECLTKYLIIGIKTVFTTLLKIVLSL